MFRMQLNVMAVTAAVLCMGLLAASPAADQASWGTTTPAVVPATPNMAAAAAAEVMAKAPAATKSFRKTLGDAAVQAYRDGQITRWDLARIRLAMLARPHAIDEAQACVTEEACAAGVMPMAAAGDGAFDWSKIISFIISKLPDILAIIKLFAA